MGVPDWARVVFREGVFALPTQKWAFLASPL